MTRFATPLFRLKPKLLVIELWGIGDLVIATPFLRAAQEKFDVTLLAKPYALELQARFWPGVTVRPFNAPWTAFKGKYQLWRWPFPEMIRLLQDLAGEHFDFGLSARWDDPRDHVLLQMARAAERLGFPRIGSGIFLTRSLPRPAPDAHRYESWRVAANALGFDLPPRNGWTPPAKKSRETVLLHTGARLAARVWPLENWRRLAQYLRSKDYPVQVACDAGQEEWWKKNSEIAVSCPRSVTELIALVDNAAVMIGNCSAPGHLAAIGGTPTFTIFGPSLPEWFAPLHPHSEWVEGKSCPFRPCKDYCHFARPFCIHDLSEDEVRPRVEQFIQKWMCPVPQR